MFFITGVPPGLISGHFPDLRAGSIVRTLSENAYFSIIFLHSSEVILMLSVFLKLLCNRHRIFH